MRRLAIDLCCGLGGWSEGLLAEGWDVVGFDIERHVYGEHRYPAQLVIQDVLTLHGSQFRDADLIVASPPCEFFSYTSMPWSRAKALAAEVRADPVRLDKELALFRACFRIQREACAAAGRHIPLIVENVRGAIPWVGRSRWNYGSYHLWGDVPALMPLTRHRKVQSPLLHLGGGHSWYAASGSAAEKRAVVRYDPRHTERRRDEAANQDGLKGVPHGIAAECTKNPGFRFDGSGRSFQTESVDRRLKNGGDWFNSSERSEQRRHWSTSPSRKAASALIAKIPLPLARHIGATFRPRAIGSAP